MIPADTIAFIRTFNTLAKEVNGTAVDKGWWKDREALVEAARAVSPELEKFAENALRGLYISLKHSELSEALESIRHGNPPDDKVPEFTGEEAEYADTIIRIMDLAAAKGLRVAEAIIAKAEMNMTRATMHGGKKM